VVGGGGVSADTCDLLKVVLDAAVLCPESDAVRGGEGQWLGCTSVCFSKTNCRRFFNDFMCTQGRNH